MEKFNIYYYGEDRSHCSSCWSSDDEDILIMITPLTLEEMILHLNIFCNVIVQEKFTYEEFLEYIAEEANDLEDNINFPCIFYKHTGRKYLPEVYEYSNCIENTYDIEEYLNPVKIVENWKILSKQWEDKKEKRKKWEKEKKEKEQKERKQKELIEKEQKEYAAFLKMKKKWEGKKKPKIPTHKKEAETASQSMKATFAINQKEKNE